MNDQQKQAMQMAFDTLKYINDEMCDYEGNDFRLETEITALREALAQPDHIANAGKLIEQDHSEQEPFGYFRTTMDGWEDCGEHDEGAKPLFENLANMMIRSEVIEAIKAAVLAERDRCKKVCDDLYKHDRKESGYDEGWNDALDIAAQVIAAVLPIEEAK